ncbi:MAG: hypothetical protein HeimAB125_09140 [Candidatus Heimdallarchaeota archaeon AB_125]|nr:MAG: hypothetical protein HeimAB125_09140 [Candidatus Heimdallarchaeota archaeon AB_125]
MSTKEYIVWKNTWRHRVLKKLEKGKLDWNSLKKETKLSPHSLNSALGGLQRSKIIQKKIVIGKTYYEICGKYTVKSQKETKNVSKEVEEEQTIEKLLSKVDVSGQEIPLTAKPLAVDVLSAKYSILVNEAEENIIVVSPFLDENTYTGKLLKMAEKKKLLLVTRTPESVSWRRQEHQDMLDKFSKIAHIIKDDKIHAKILMVDKKKCIISSMNLTSNSIVKSKEYGIYLESPDVVNSILEFIDGLGEIENPETKD